MRQIDLVAAKNIIIKQIKDYFGDRIAVIGISGGIDSALVATLCVEALGKDNVLGVLLPYGKQSDINDSFELIEFLDIPVEEVNIFNIVNQYDFTDKFVKANIMSRTRMTVLYAFANLHQGLVVGTTNASEMAIGYFTKFGDGGCDFEPIADLYKTEVWELAKILGIPDSIIKKKPTAGLWADQTDESEMGVTYDQLDRFLQGESINPLIDAKINQMVERSEHKRHLPPCVKIS